jgi:hypothetical protein
MQESFAWPRRPVHDQPRAGPEQEGDVRGSEGARRKLSAERDPPPASNETRRRVATMHMDRALQTREAAGIGGAGSRKAPVLHAHPVLAIYGTSSPGR